LQDGRHVHRPESLLREEGLILTPDGGHEFHKFSGNKFVLIGAIRVWSFRLEELATVNGLHFFFN